MKVQIKDAAGTSGVAVVDEYDIADLLKTSAWFGHGLRDHTTEEQTVEETIDELQEAITARCYEQYPLAQALGLEITRA